MDIAKTESHVLVTVPRGRILTIVLRSGHKTRTQPSSACVVEDGRRPSAFYTLATIVSKMIVWCYNNMDFCSTEISSAVVERQRDN